MAESFGELSRVDGVRDENLAPALKTTTYLEGMWPAFHAKLKVGDDG